MELGSVDALLGQWITLSSCKQPCSCWVCTVSARFTGCRSSATCSYCCHCRFKQKTSTNLKDTNHVQYDGIRWYLMMPIFTSDMPMCCSIHFTHTMQQKYAFCITETYVNRNQDSIVSILTKFWAGMRNYGQIPSRWNRLLPSPEHPGGIYGPPTLLFNGHWSLFPQGYPLAKA